VRHARRGTTVFFRCSLLMLLLSVGCMVPALGAQSSAANAAPAAGSTQGEALAVFDGQPIYQQDLPAADQVQLDKMMQQVYSVQVRALRAAMEHRLVETEAKRQGKSPEELFKSEVLTKVNEPTDEQVKAYYEVRREQIKQPLEKVQESIRGTLKNTATQKAETIYVQNLMQKALNDASLVLLVKPPKTDVTVDPLRMRGDAKAPVTIVEFSDYSCPFCRAAESTMNELLAKYPVNVKVSYRDFPLRELHPEAQQAAEASRCAGEQGKFWEYHDALFANPKKHAAEDLVADAHALQLDQAKFDACMTSQRYRAQVDQDVLLGSRAGVVSTPGFFINGKFVSGAQPVAVFEKIIEDDLKPTAASATASLR
jgi:protein-disulfide isomerase